MPTIYTSRIGQWRAQFRNGAGPLFWIAAAASIALGSLALWVMLAIPLLFGFAL